MLTIRSATLADAAAIANLAGELGYPVDADEIVERLDFLLRSPDDQVLVAELDGGVVGWTHVETMLSLEYGRRAEIFGLIVADGYRGQGIGRALMSAAERWAIEEDLPLLRLRTNVVRDEAHAFYERLGYTAVKQQKVYQKPL